MNTNKNIILVVIIAFLIGGIGGYAINQWGERDDFNYPFRTSDSDEVAIPQGMHRMSDGTLMGNQMGSGSGMGHMMVTSERDFLENMIPHHQEAVDTAKEVIERGGNTPEVKTLVENIVRAQEKEIADMKQWYEAWYGTPYVDKGKYQPMMRELSSLSGKELDKAFLSDMIMHHMGAIMMARSVTSYVEHVELKQLTGSIIETQSEEIALMRRLLTEIK